MFVTSGLSGSASPAAFLALVDSIMSLSNSCISGTVSVCSDTAVAVGRKA